MQSNGTLWSWGGNLNGQLGNGTTVNSTTPARVGTTTWEAVAAGSDFTIAVQSNGTLWAWGDNTTGQLGIGTTTSSTIPVQVGSGTDWVAVAAGANHAAAIKSNHTLWSWGGNLNGQLGNGTTVSSTTPVQVGTGANWIAVAAGNGFTVAMQSDGTLWSWGNNSTGQLGNGTTTNTDVPVQIGAPVTDGGTGGGGGSCFIATAAYGSILDPRVVALRRFRDKHLITNATGRALVAIYYRHSPPAAEFIRRHDSLRTLTRWGLTPVVYGIERPWLFCLPLLIGPGLAAIRLKKRNGR